MQLGHLQKYQAGKLLWMGSAKWVLLLLESFHRQILFVTCISRLTWIPRKCGNDA